MITASRLLIAALGSLALVGTAAAQDPDPNADPNAMPNPEASPPDPNATPVAVKTTGTSLTLGKGKIVIGGSTLNINLTTDLVAKPVSIAPSIYYGVSDKLTVGLTHDNGTTRWTPRPAIRSFFVSAGGITIAAAGGSGICVTGDENGCADVYNNFGADVLYSIKDEQFSLAGHGGFDVNSIDPFALAVRVGVLGRYAVTPEFSIVFDPRLSFGITERDAGNKETIDVPVWAWYQINAQLGAYVNLGINGPLDGFGDAYGIPLGIGATYAVNEQLSAGLDFSFLNLLGEGGGGDARALGLRVAYAL